MELPEIPDSESKSRMPIHRDKSKKHDSLLIYLLI